jgi:hypothetical protein
MQIIEYVGEHYERQEVLFGQVYKRCPECVVVQCACRKRSTHKLADIISLVVPACECGKDEMTNIREELVLQLLDEEDETHHHPWRYWHAFAYAEVLRPEIEGRR